MCLGCSLRGPCAVCLCVMEAPGMCQSVWFGLGLGTRDLRWVGSWHGCHGPNSGLSKTRRFNPDYAHHFSLSLSLSVSISLHWAPSPPFPPTLFLFLLLVLHPSINTLQPYPKKYKAPTGCSVAMVTACATSFHSCHWSVSEWSLRVDFRKSIFNACLPI